MSRIRILAGTVLALVAVTAQGAAAPLAQARTRIVAAVSTVRAGEEFTVDLRAEGIPAIYGADVRLRFDPDLLEVVDADTNTPGIQVTTGSFLPAGLGMVIKNQVHDGVMVHALTLLRPAAPVQGDGSLAQVTFRGKRAGDTTIELTECLFGTQIGEAIVPLLNPAVQIHVQDATSAAIRSIGTTAANGSTIAATTAYVKGYLGGGTLGRTSLAIGALAVTALVGLMVAWGTKALRRRARR